MKISKLFLFYKCNKQELKNKTMDNLRDFTDGMMGIHNPLVNIDKVIDFWLNMSDKSFIYKDNDRHVFYQRIGSLAHLLYLYEFSELFHSFIVMEFNFSKIRKDCQYTYTRSINSLFGCAIVDFTRAIQKVYINKDVKKPARLDEMIKYINNNYENLFKNN